MATEKEILDKQNSVFKQWYKDNREEYNKKRRERYQTDPEYRERKRKEARETKRRMKKERGGSIERPWKGSTILVYRIGAAASIVGCKPNKIIEWENRGVIPTPSFGGRQRVYTQNQVDMMRDLYLEISELGDDFSSVKMVENNRKLHIKSHWGEGL